MDYALLKELKEAGFPTYECEANPFGIEPTLSELIEACGEDFWKLEKHQDRWRAFDAEVQDEISTYVVQGSTPEEAVARLWLALNAKDKEL